MNLNSGRASVAMLRMMGCANGRSARHLLHSDCVVDEKTVVLQKKENEGFGFVLRGAKGKNFTHFNVLLMRVQCRSFDLNACASLQNALRCSVFVF